MRAPRKILVANRGEIAVRVIRACHEVGSKVVAVYSEADRGALHVRLADEAYPIGEARAVHSYLHAGKLLQVARYAGCDAVHPGYGFLSENARFVEAVEAAGLTFIGPDARAIRLMGDKVAARREAIAAGVPVVPGGLEPVRDEAELVRRAAELGLPLILKAAGGGGGKGIRVIRNPSELGSAFRLASSEAQAAFGNPELYVERFLEAARHVEVQILGDGRGNVVHLGERECSLQRRHQKLVEECPSPSISDETRHALWEAALALGRRIAYRSAGTMEFLVEGAGGPSPRFYFMEMNTRLQVEHPVTEMVTGIDLVREQLWLAAGNPLALHDRAIQHRGAAIEARIYAEDPAHGFAPSAGRITALNLPAGPGTRLDTALFVGDRVSLYYDPLIAKLVVWGRDRTEAVERLRRALEELRITGVATTAPLLRLLAASPEFERAEFHINFLERFACGAMAEPAPETALQDAAIAAAVRSAARSRARKPAASASAESDSREMPSRWSRFGRASQLGRLDAL